MNTPVTKTLNDIPKVSGAWPVVGSMREMRRDVLGMFTRAFHDCGEVFRYQFGPFTAVCFARPECVREVLVDKADCFEKSRFTEGLIPVVGNGLLTSRNAFHKRQRFTISASSAMLTCWPTTPSTCNATGATARRLTSRVR